MQFKRLLDKKTPKAKVYLVCGIPGSGKSWVCDQLKDKFKYVAHDNNITKTQNGDYVKAIIKASDTNNKLLAEAPFSISEIKEPLEKVGLTVVPVFIIETLETHTKRYESRDSKPIPKGHLTRLETFKKRAKEWGCYSGIFQQVLDHLKKV